MDLYTIFFGNTTELFIFNCIGYIGSLLVLISMMMTQMIKLRFINSTGCIFSIVFSILTLNMPVLVLNSALLLINVIQIFRYYTHKKEYDIVASEVDSSILKHFVQKYNKVITNENPGFFKRFEDANYAKVIYADDTIVGMLIGRTEDGKNLDVYLDYVDKDSLAIPLFINLYNTVRRDGITDLKILHQCPNYKKFYENFDLTTKDDIYEIRL